jgi:ABC-type dipeptide/oligopeptide/nickel transport system permease component
VQATIVLIALLYALINLAIDMLYGVLDPRVRTT